MPASTSSYIPPKLQQCRANAPQTHAPHSFQPSLPSSAIRHPDLTSSFGLDSLLTHQHRIYEDELHSAIEARSETLQALRELGPPDLVHLIKQPIKNPAKQVQCHGPLIAKRAHADMRRRSVSTIMSPG